MASRAHHFRSAATSEPVVRPRHVSQILQQVWHQLDLILHLPLEKQWRRPDRDAQAEPGERAA